MVTVMQTEIFLQNKKIKEDICFLLDEEPEGFPETDIGILLAKVDDVLLSLPKTKFILSTALEINWSKS